MRWLKRHLFFRNLLPKVIILLLLSLCNFLQPQVYGAGAAEYLFETGKKYYEQGNYSEAMQEFKKTLLIDPNHSQAQRYVQVIERDIYGLEEDEDLPPCEEQLAREEAMDQILFEQEMSEIDKGGRYMLGIGDTVQVSVWRHNEFDATVTIRPDEMISLPYIGEVKACGLTPSELSKSINLKLSKLLKEPKVTVTVTGFESKRVLVLGEVNRPGMYTISQPTTALSAVMLAGGYKKYANLKTTLVARKPYSYVPEIIPVDLASVVYRSRFYNDLELQPGDVVYVPNSFLGKIVNFMGFFYDTVKPAADSYFWYSDVAED